VVRFLTICLVALLRSSELHAADRSAAELFPLESRAYVELRQPAALADALEHWVKGTVLENGLKLLHDRRDAMTDARLMRSDSWLHSLVAATSPEMFAELRNVGGAAIGYTGLTDKNIPKLALVLLPGESVALRLYLRTLLINDSQLRRIDTLGDVPIFQSRGVPEPGFNQLGQPQPVKAEAAKEGECELTLAYTPGLFVAGSNKQVVVDVLSRWRTPAKTSVRDEPAWGAAPKIAGAWGFVRPPALLADADRLRKSDENAIDGELLAWWKLVVGTKSLSIVTSEASVANDDLLWKIQAIRDPAVSSPLLDLLASSLATTPVAKLPPSEGACVTLALPRADRVARVTKLADAIAKMKGVAGALPSDLMPQAEQTSGVRLRDELLTKLDAISLHWPSLVTTTSWPTITLHAANADAWSTAVPKLAHGFGWTAAPPNLSRETVNGTLVTSLMIGERAVHAITHSHGTSFGPDRASVLKMASSFVAASPEQSASARATIQLLCVLRFPHWPMAERLPQVVDSVMPPIVTTDQDWTTALSAWPTIACEATTCENRTTIELRWGTANQRKLLVERAIPLLEKLGHTNGSTIPGFLPPLRR
jgi:hypothetical protein